MGGRFVITIWAGILAAVAGPACSPLSNGGVPSCGIQQQTVTTGSQRNLNDSSVEQAYAQSFQVFGTLSVTGVSLSLISTYSGITPHNLTLNLAIQGDAATAGPNAASAPNGTVLGTGTLSTTKISNAVALNYPFTGFSSVSLTANSFYWLVLSEPGAPSNSTTFISWEASSSPAEPWPALVSSGFVTPVWTAIPSLIFSFSIGC